MRSLRNLRANPRSPDGIAGSRCHRHLGAQLLLPEVELVKQALGPVGILLGEIVPFAGILTQVVKFVATVVIEFDELPVTVADRGARRPG